MSGTNHSVINGYRAYSTDMFVSWTDREADNSRGKHFVKKKIYIYKIQ